MKSILTIIVLVVLPLFVSAQRMTSTDSLTYTRLYDAQIKLALQMDSLTNEIIPFIDRMREGSSHDHILAVSLLSNINTKRVNWYLFTNLETDIITSGFLTSEPYLEILRNNHRFIEELFINIERIVFSKDQVIYVSLFLRSFLTKEQISTLAETTIQKNENKILVANYQAIYDFNSQL